MGFFYFWMLVQIVLESLPVSSSGHQILLERLLHTSPGDCFDWYGQLLNYPVKNFITLLEHALHVPTVLVIAVFFYSRWFFLLRNLRRCWRISIKLMVLVALSNSITVLFYIFFKQVPAPLPLYAGFLITACLLISLRWFKRKKICMLTAKTALFLGVVQGVALMPGISRFAAVLVAASWLGFKKSRAFEVTFMIQWPLIAVASIRSVYLLYSNTFLSHLAMFNVCTVFVVGAVVAYFLLCWMYCLHKSNKLWWFGLYMFVPALLACVS